jgi:hypothetical protein
MLQLLTVASQQLGKHFTLAMNTHPTIEELLDASFFCAVCILSKESR